VVHQSFRQLNWVTSFLAILALVGSALVAIKKVAKISLPPLPTAASTYPELIGICPQFSNFPILRLHRLTLMGWLLEWTE